MIRPSAVDLYAATQATVGQEKARRRLAVLLWGQTLLADDKLDKQPVGAVVAGPTGVGKTFTISQMCRALKLPYAEQNATQYTDKGYVGMDLSQMFLPLLEAAAAIVDEEDAQHGGRYARQMPYVLERRDEDLDRVLKVAQSGVVLLDEFDKWIQKRSDETGRNMGRKLQAELLKMVEGSVVWVSKSDDSLGVPFDTSKTLIIAAGAFIDLLKHTSKRLDISNIRWDDEAHWDLVEPHDFIKYGVLPELAGRLAHVIVFKPLRSHHLADLMSREGGVIDEYRALFAEQNCILDARPEGMRMLADLALSRGTGARALRNAASEVFGDALFEAAAAPVPTVCLLDHESARTRRATVYPRQQLQVV